MISDAREQPHELLVTAMMRGKMCEELGRAAGQTEVAAFFTDGLFSTLDALLNAPLARVVSRLPLTNPVREALLENKGPMGAALRCALAYERGEWSEVHCLGLSRAKIQDAFLATVRWVESVDREIASVGES
jgi:EAL and modified HD-GYP domain-containing signal transduction protein